MIVWVWDTSTHDNNCPIPKTGDGSKFSGVPTQKLDIENYNSDINHSSRKRFNNTSDKLSNRFNLGASLPSVLPL